MIITIARPENLDLAVPPLTDGKSGLTLPGIMNGYTKYVDPDWERACNVEYRAGPSGPVVGYLHEEGTTFSKIVPAWPGFAVVDGKAKIVSPDELKRINARFAFQVGPLLLSGGELPNFAAEIKAGNFTGLRPSDIIERAALGIRGDGAVVHIAGNFSLHNLALNLLDHGCIDALALDGGGSVGVIDQNNKLLYGHTVRELGSALVFKKIESHLNSSPATQTGGMTVCLDPGHGGRDRNNRGPTGYVEADGALDIALTAGQVLRSHGIEVVFTRTRDKDLSGSYYNQTNDLQGRCDIANSAKADCFVSVHTNAGGGKGTETFHYSGSVEGEKLANIIQNQVITELKTYYRRVAESRFYVLRNTKMTAALMEVAFHDYSEEEKLLKQPEFRARAGYAIAEGILKYLGRV